MCSEFLWFQNVSGIVPPRHWGRIYWYFSPGEYTYTSRILTWDARLTLAEQTVATHINDGSAFVRVVTIALANLV